MAKVETNLPVRHVQQPLSKLCWATCILMVREVLVNKRNYDITPEKVFEAVLYYDDNVDATTKMLLAGLERWGAECSEHRKGKATYLEVQTEIGANRPIIVGLTYPNSKHVIVIGGYELRGPTRWWKVFDPASNAAEWQPFRHLEESATWTDTFFVRARNVNV